MAVKRLQECANAIAKEAGQLQKAAGDMDSGVQLGTRAAPTEEQPGNAADLSKITVVVDSFLVEVLATSLRGNAL